MMERWARIPGFEYEASDQGNIRSLLTGTVLRSHVGSESGHRKVGLCRNGVRHVRWVQRLILEAFAGPCPEGFEASHLNGNAADNRLANLAWESASQNQARRAEHGTSNRGERHGRAKLTEEAAREIKASSDRVAVLAARHRISQQTIIDIRSRRSWKWLDERSLAKV